VPPHQAVNHRPQPHHPQRRTREGMAQPTHVHTLGHDQYPGGLAKKQRAGEQGHSASACGRCHLGGLHLQGVVQHVKAQPRHQASQHPHPHPTAPGQHQQTDCDQCSPRAHQT